jgi:hypothetical protein
MGTQRELVRYRAQQLGWQAMGWGAATVGGTVLALWAGLPLLALLVVLGGGAGTAAHAWSWLRYRGEHGLRF